MTLRTETHDGWPFYIKSSAGAEHGLPMPYADSGRPADSRPPSDPPCGEHCPGDCGWNPDDPLDPCNAT